MRASSFLFSQKMAIVPARSRARVVRGALEAVDGDCGLMLTSWLSSFDTTHLRAASRACRKIFLRNCPVAFTKKYLFLEQAAPPDLPSRFSIIDRLLPSPIERPRANPYSPLRCWRLHLNNVARDLVGLRRSCPRLWQKLIKDRAFQLAAVAKDTDILNFVDPSFMSDRDVVLAAVARNGYALEFADPSLKRDRDVVLAAVAQNGFALDFADEGFKSDRDVVLAAIAQKGEALQCAAPSFMSDRDVVLAAVAQDGNALAYPDSRLRSDREIVLAAVTQNGDALEFADPSLKESDREIRSAAVAARERSRLQYLRATTKRSSGRRE